MGYAMEAWNYGLETADDDHHKQALADSPPGHRWEYIILVFRPTFVIDQPVHHNSQHDTRHTLPLSATPRQAALIMSPHAIHQSGKHSVDLSKFAVTRNAFLPEHSPPKVLADPYYEPWELVVQHLPTLIRTGGIRESVARLPVLSTDRLRSQAEWRRAYSMLAYMTHAYVWGGDKPDEILPPQITLPFLRASEHLELPPVLTYAAANLWNFSCTGHDFSNLEDLSTLFSFTGTESESWFLLISAAMEAKAAGILQTMMAALEAVKTCDYQAVTDALGELRTCIQNVSALLERMYEKCDPMTFYHRIRPFLAGSKNMDAAGLPRGVFYDEGDGKGEWRQLRGGSNGQSSLIQFFDVVLGVEHHTHGSAGQKSFHTEVREYMPGPHRRFLVHVARASSIRELALAAPTTADQRRLRDAYTAATEALSGFRNKHIQIVTRYVILPSKQPWKGAARQNLASSSSERNGDEELTGTGGTMLVPFLKKARDETSQAGKLER
ncbi:Indoleamine 2,3-dioxygenase [Tolypocladium ophioglossoides CBS 100239]|uniref:Indoleamine 2,3-dioxygenase n=1 Tax=Tolypocladium ophioglossoides (strain CBS 100239) TaxID=1163406 RepID=A0A0L0NBD0_TOLOC|nr:Indoleamine 2,3-dioxygenase [Tolypocladium ophioglossoides CBS 100239]